MFVRERAALGRRRWGALGRRGLDHRAGLVDPAVPLDAAVELEVGVKLGGVLGLHGADLPVVVDAGVVELLLQLRADARELGEVVGRAPRGRKALKGFARL